MASGHRQERIEELLRSFIATELMLVDNATIPLVTIMAVKVTKDLRHATIFWCKAIAEPTETPDAEIEQYLRQMVPQLRKRIAQELELRYVPELHFKFDQTPFMAEKIDSLLRKVD